MNEVLFPEQWLEIAADDLSAARALANQPSGYPAKVCFLAQQCAERAIKAVIISFEANMPRTHELTELWEAARAAGVPQSEAAEAALVLSPYAVEARYDALEKLSRDEAGRALALAAPVLAWAQALISRAR